jgi:DNA replication initiation complex subunit (GINS family)
MKKGFQLILIISLLTACSSGNRKKKPRRSQTSKYAVRRMPAYNRQAIEKSQGMAPVIPMVYDEKAEYNKLVKELKEEVKIPEPISKKEDLKNAELKALVSSPKDKTLIAPPSPSKELSPNISQKEKDETDYANLLKQITEDARILEGNNIQVKTLSSNDLPLQHMDSNIQETIIANSVSRTPMANHPTAPGL